MLKKILIPGSTLNFAISFCLVLLFQGCAVSQKSATTTTPITEAEKLTNYGYIPLDALPVFQEPGRSCTNGEKDTFKLLRDCLPDNTVRLAIGEFNASGGLDFGPLSVGAKNKSYQVVLDYVNNDVAYIPIYVRASTRNDSGKVTYLPLYDVNVSNDSNIEYSVKAATRKHVDANGEKIRGPKSGEVENEQLSDYHLVEIPVYIGVGLRLTATFRVLEGDVSLSLGGLAAAAEANQITGSLVVQTLGATGKDIINLLPLPSEINQTSLQQAISAIGSIKATLGEESAILTPRVLGIYNPVAGGRRVIDGIISLLASKPVEWYRPCIKPANEVGPRD